LQRKQIRKLMDQWEREHPDRIEKIFASLTNVAPSQLADPNLFDFAGLGGGGGDTVSWLMPEASLQE